MHRAVPAELQRKSSHPVVGEGRLMLHAEQKGEEGKSGILDQLGRLGPWERRQKGEYRSSSDHKLGSSPVCVCVGDREG